MHAGSGATDRIVRAKSFPLANTGISGKFGALLPAMIRSRTASFRTRTCILTAAALAAGTLAWALHPKNAGPETFEIKFKLPPPKPLTAEEELKTFKVAKGFHVELVAAEPMIETPIAQSWDEKGALYHPCSEKKWRRQPPPGKGSECESNSDPCMKAKATAWKV
jgi:hypothetical protein